MMGKKVRLGTSLERVISAPVRRLAVTTSAYAVVDGADVPVPAALEDALHEVLELLHRCAERLSKETDQDEVSRMLDQHPSGPDDWRANVRAALDELSREGGDVAAAIEALEEALAEG